MTISEMIKFLEDAKEEFGDLRVESITGFWINVNERLVVPAVGNGKSIKDVIKET